MRLCVVLLLLPLLVQCDLKRPVDCKEIYLRGAKISEVYTIYPNGAAESAVNVYCDMGCENKKEPGGWTVFQRRVDGKLSFYRNWQEYKEGFGDASGDYWLGLEMPHLMTSSKQRELQVDMEDFEDHKVFARYSRFRVGPEKDGYPMYTHGFFNGGAGNSFYYHHGMKFSTYDRDQDKWSRNCAAQHLGGYWYNACYHSNPNGVFLWGPTSHNGIGVVWHHFKGNHYSLKSITMKIR